MSRRRIVVVGASLAGLRMVQALRRREIDAEVVLIGEETHLPYDRPPLSKGVLTGTLGADAVGLATADVVAGLDVELRLGTRATSIDVAGRRVAVTSAGSTEAATEHLAYDDLVIATGSSARRPSGLPDLDGVHVLRTLEDSLAIRAAFAAGPRVVILGGGFIGAETASAARSLGLDAAVVDLAPVMMERALGAVIGARMTQRAADHGVDLHLGTGVARVSGTERVESVHLDDGTTLDADLLVVGIGAAPNDQWLAGSGLTVADGVVCDQYLAAAPHVYAVGDVARWHHPLYDKTVRTEHWTSASEHADAVASTLAGSPTPAAAVPWVWSDQFGIKLQVAGVLEPDDEIRFLVDDAPKMVAIAGSHGVQHAAFGIGSPGALVRQRMALATQPPFPPE